MPRSHPPVYPHGPLRKIFEDVWMVSGTVPMPGPLPMTFSRNMIVMRRGRSLTLISSMRLDEEGLAALERLGDIEHVIRIASFHGLDDPFYAERYGALVWAVEGSGYRRGFDQSGATYFEPDVWMTSETELPIPDSRVVVIDGVTPEGLVLFERHGGVLIAGDALQNWVTGDRYFTWPARLLMKAMGFLKPYNVGPGWLRESKPDRAQVGALLDLEFEHVLPSHGAEVVGDARALYRPSIERAARG